jgi:hypothetical protein
MASVACDVTREGVTATMRVGVTFSAEQLNVLQFVGATLGNGDDVMDLHADRRLQVGKLSPMAPAAPAEILHVGWQLADHV